MLVLIAFCAALYVAVLIPFKLAVLVPGITEIRPGAALPIVFSIFFGPAAAWGAAFGNVIGDFLGGTIGPGSFFGFFGNFIYGYVPYRVIRALKPAGQSLFSGFGWIGLISGIALASALCATIISLGVDWLKIVEFSFLVHAIFINNFGVSIILAPLLAIALMNRVKQMRLSYDQVLSEEQLSPPPLKQAGFFIVLATVVLIYAIMMFPSIIQPIHFLSDNPALVRLGGAALLTVLPIILL